MCGHTPSDGSQSRTFRINSLKWIRARESGGFINDLVDLNPTLHSSGATTWYMTDTHSSASLLQGRANTFQGSRGTFPSARHNVRKPSLLCCSRPRRRDTIQAHTSGTSASSDNHRKWIPYQTCLSADVDSSPCSASILCLVGGWNLPWFCLSRQLSGPGESPDDLRGPLSSSQPTQPAFHCASCMNVQI